MLRYEYKTVAFDEAESCGGIDEGGELYFMTQKRDQNRANIERLLNELGGEGWEIIQMQTWMGIYRQVHGVIFLKRVVLGE